MATAAQIKRIHILIHKLGIIDDDYRAMLSGYNQLSGREIKSSKQLTIPHAAQLIVRLSEMARIRGIETDFRKKKYDELGKRDGMATPAQLRMLEAMWAEVTFQTDAKKRQIAYEKFIKRITGIDSPRFLEPIHVRKIKRAIENMKKPLPKEAV